MYAIVQLRSIYETTSLNVQARCTVTFTRHECIPLRSFLFNVFMSFIRLFAIYWINSKRCSMFTCTKYIHIVYLILGIAYNLFTSILLMCWYTFWNVARDICITLHSIGYRMMKFTWNCYFAILKISRNKISFSIISFSELFRFSFRNSFEFHLNLNIKFKTFWFWMWWRNL